MTQTLVSVEFNACPSNLKAVRRLVRERTAAVGCSEECVQQLALVVDEAIANVIRHGYCGDRSGEIELRLLHDNGTLEFFLRDYARPVDRKGIKPRDLSECRPGGLGINFIDSVMDSWEFRKPRGNQGNILYMKKKIQ